MPTEKLAEPANSRTLGDGASHRQNLIAGIIILFLFASFFLIQYDRNRQAEQSLQSWYQTTAAGQSDAPDQYRIALPFAAHFLEVHTRLKMRQSFPLIQSLSFGFGLALLYDLLVTSSTFQASSSSQRLAASGLFFAAAQLPVLWIFPWERPETLLTFFYVAAAAVVVLERRIPLSLACLLALLLSAAQSFARADAPMAVGLALLIGSTTGWIYRSRYATAVLGALCLATGVATQLYLKHLFPNAHLPANVPAVQLVYNFDLSYGYAAYRIPAFLLALIPLIVILWLLRGRRGYRLDAADKLTLLIALVYLPIYMTFGIISEVRLYVPYMFLLAPLMSKACVWFASDEPFCMAAG